MALNVEMKDGECQIAIEGEMTIFVVNELKQALQAPLREADAITVDLSQVSEIDGAGLQLMVASKIESIALGNQLSFINHSAPVQALMQLSNLVEFFGDPLELALEAA